MKILIFGLPRCGTTSLFNFLMEYFPKNYIFKYEPYKKETFFFEDNLLVKTVLSDKELLLNGENLEEHSIRIIKDYDKVIYLTRKNIENIKLSFYKMREKNFIEKNEINILPSKEYTDKQIDKWLKIFQSVSLSGKIYYYEDLFLEIPSNSFYDLLKYLDINYKKNLFDKYIHPKNKDKSIKMKKTLL